MNNLIVDFENSIENLLLSSDFGAWLLKEYRLADRIYHSSISQIYLLEEYSTGNFYTLKIITDSSMFGDLDILKEINHSNIVSIKHVISLEKFVFIIQDYVQGLTLQQYIERNGTLSEEETIKIGNQLCAIFNYLHTIATNPLIFRDLKPANIILCNNDEIRLIDLSSIRKFKSEAHNDTINIGTIGFSAPEQFGYGQTDERTDIYTIGATLYYLLCADKPVFDKHKVKSIKDFREDISTDLVDIIDKCTRFSPDERFQGIRDLESALNLIGKKSIKKLFRDTSDNRKKQFMLITIVVIVIIASTTLYNLDKLNDTKATANINAINNEIVDKDKVNDGIEEFSFDKTTILEVFWAGTIPQKLLNMQDTFKVGPQSEYSDNTFHIAIAEWDKTKDFKQMEERIFRVDSVLTLRAEGYKDVEADITPGSLTMGDGSGQVYVCFLRNKENMVSGVKYKLTNSSGHWIIPDDMYIERPVK